MILSLRFHVALVGIHICQLGEVVGVTVVSVLYALSDGVGVMVVCHLANCLWTTCFYNFPGAKFIHPIKVWWKECDRSPMEGSQPVFLPWKWI